MQYLNQSDETYVHQCLIVIYIYFKFHEIPCRGYLGLANYMDFKSIQGL